tara:strand:- start:5809 stop:6591 length:783 start_codon:yes stop_codon:yes gene_type:complete
MGFPVYIKSSRRRISIAKEVAEVNRIRLGYERGLTKRFITLFRKTARQAAHGHTNGGTVSSYTVELENEVGAILRAHYTDVINQFGARVFDGYKFETRFEVLIDQFYQLFGAEKVVSISRTTRNLIRGAILRAEKDALGVDETAKLIVERTSGSIGRSRAATIARTETHAAASFATHKVTNELPLPHRKQWSSVNDARTRDHHAAMNGVSVGHDDDFIVRVKGTEYRMAHTHDPRGGAINNINCRCVTLYIPEEDVIFRD